MYVSSNSYPISSLRRRRANHNVFRLCLVFIWIELKILYIVAIVKEEFILFPASQRANVKIVC